MHKCTTTCYADCGSDWLLSANREREMTLTEAGGCQYSEEVPNVKNPEALDCHIQ